MSYVLRGRSLYGALCGAFDSLFWFCALFRRNFEINELCAARSIFVCMGHCVVRLILFSGFVLYFAETPKPMRYVLYEPSLCYGCACFHIYDFVLIDNIVALCWAA